MVQGKVAAMSVLCQCLCPYGIGIFLVLFRRGCKHFGALVALGIGLLLGWWVCLGGVGVLWLSCAVFLAGIHAFIK